MISNHPGHLIVIIGSFWYYCEIRRIGCVAILVIQEVPDDLTIEAADGNDYQEEAH